jgi:MFS family permease
MVAPLYIGEIAPPEIRGTLLVLQELCIVTGIVIAFYITYGTRYIQSYWAWRLPFLIQLIPAVLMCAGVFFLPYSPRWLCQKGRDEEALRTLATTDERVMEEWLEIRAECAYRKEVSAAKHPKLVQPGLWNAFKLQVLLYIDCWKMPIYKRTQVAVGLMFFQQFVGINALIVSFWSRYKSGSSSLILTMCIVLLAESLREYGAGLRDATDYVGYHEYLPGCCLYLVSLGYGSLRPPQASLGRCCVHVYFPFHYCYPGW